jgi:hypothetical protein
VTTVTAPEDWRINDGTVPLTDVVNTAQCSYASINHAMKQGLVPVAGMGGPGVHGSTRRINLDDALMIVAVAALAVAAGLAFNILFRSLRETGARITAEGLTIPLNT